MPRQPQLVICDDDRLFHQTVKSLLSGKFECRSAYTADEAFLLLRKHRTDLLLLDIQLRSPDEGLRMIPRINELDPDVAVVMSSGLSDFATVREAMRLGAVDYVSKDFEPDELAHVLEQVLARRALIRRRSQQNFEVAAEQRKHTLLGGSPQMEDLRRTITKVRQSPANVLITGETGTGKEVVARQLRKTLADGSLEPFIAVDSATIQSSTAESQLFGYERGAFTGADKTTKGIFEAADGGIVYFDEIGNMPLEIQAKLLRVLQEKEICRLGSTRTIELEFRVISATNKDLDSMVSAGSFKADLLQRLNVLPIHLPPLRQRQEDISALIEHFLRLQGQPVERFQFLPAAQAALRYHSWPGNVRELGNVVSYLVTMADTPLIDKCDLPPQIRGAALPDSPADMAEQTAFHQQMDDHARKILSASYAKHSGNISKMAQELQMDRSHLHTKLKELGIHKPSDKQ